MARAHARLSPSSAERWMHCPGSVNAAEPYPDTSSPYAMEGTAAHALAEYCLIGGVDPFDMLGHWIDPESGKFLSGKKPGAFEVTQDMTEAVQVYVKYVLEIWRSAPNMEGEIEARLDLRSIEGMEFGTGDFAGYDPDEKTIDVVDYKHGVGVAVSARDNWQLVSYTIGVVRQHHNRGVRKVRMHIVQPRAFHAEGRIRVWEISIADLLDLESDLNAGAKATFPKDAPRVAGDWCKFCKAAQDCPALREKAFAAARAAFDDGAIDMPDPAKLTAKEMGDMLRKAEVLKIWLHRLEEYAHAEAVAGRPPLGFKLVAKRAIRKWKDEDATYDFLSSFDFDEREFMELMSPAALEKTLFRGKEKKALLEPYFEKVSSGTKLVPEEDPAPSVKATVAEAFGG